MPANDRADRGFTGWLMADILPTVRDALGRAAARDRPRRPHRLAAGLDGPDARSGMIDRRSPQMRHTVTVTTYRIAEAADLLGVSDDTLRRWIDQGRLDHRPAPRPRRPSTGAALAGLAEALADSPDREGLRSSSVSARNRLPGIVVAVRKDTVMAQVEMICGPHRIVSLMSTDAADELGLARGERAIASIKSTNVVVERP